MPRAVLFDLDDTLFDHQASTKAALGILRDTYAGLRAWTAAELHARHSALLERLHLDVLAGRRSVDDARIERFATLFADAGAPLGPDELAGVAAQYRDAYNGSWRLVPGALALLEALHGRARLGVVTNNPVSEQTRKLEKLRLAPYFDAIVISEAAGVSKPDPRIFALALDRLGCAARDAVMVGDGWPTDIVGAIGAGLAAVWFHRDGRPRPEDLPVRELASLEPAGEAAAVILDGLANG